jgi:DNA-binding HxlR family transcriptional regulator
VTVEYELTPLGRSLAGAVATIRGWALEHIEQVEAARARYDAQPARSGPPTPQAGA